MPSLDPVTSSTALSALFLCGLMGVLGQGIRAAVGLKNANAVNSTTPTQQSQFSAAYFAVSMMVGFIAGVLAGLIVGLDQFTMVHLDNIKLLLGIAVSGYAGADFIENNFSFVIPGGGSSAVVNTPVVVPAASSARPQSVPFVTDVSAAPLSAVSQVSAALKSVAPQVQANLWAEPLNDAFDKYGLNNNNRKAAALGQFLVEAGSYFKEIVENLNYTTADRIAAVWPARFASAADAQAYVRNPESLANRVYANRNGNGDEASGDGYEFRGRGLIQLTGRDEYTAFGAVVGKSAAEAAAYCETPEGAALSGCWYLFSRGCLPLADNWQISEITRRVNGAAMLQNSLRIQYSHAALTAFGG